MEIKNLKETAERILNAINGNEKILLYGDNDLDGICSLLILKETILSLGGNVSAVYFPDREKEGYGITHLGLETLKKYAPALFITLDCGISDFEEIKMATEMGLQVIVIDHHEVIDELPPASIIVDPKQKGDNYPFKNLSTTGIVFKLAEKMLEGKMGDRLRKNFLEMVALATLADMMPQEKENKIMIDEGLISLKNSLRPAFRAISGHFQVPKEISKVISILGVRHFIDGLPASYLFLTASHIEGAKRIFDELVEIHEIKREESKKMLKEIEESINRDEKIIFLGNPEWSFSLLGGVASNLCQVYKKPVFLFKRGELESRGSVRAPNGVNCVELMKKCKTLLISFGGHPPAAGFRIRNENLEAFKKCIIENL